MDNLQDQTLNLHEGHEDEFGEDEDGGMAMDEEHPMWRSERITLISVGIDVGSSTSHLIFSRLTLRRQGIARRLFAATFDAAREKGYEKIFTFVRADNPAALQTYLRQGFVVVGNAKRQAKIDGQYIDEILIEKWI